MRGAKLYRLRDIDMNLLYVGQSLSVFNRLSYHEAASVWFAKTVHVEIDHFDCPDAALKAERKAIQTEKPMYNIAHANEGGKARAKALRRSQKARPVRKGVPGAPRVTTPEQDAEILRLHGLGVSLEKIAADTGVKYPTVRRRIVNHEKEDQS